LQKTGAAPDDFLFYRQVAVKVAQSQKQADGVSCSLIGGQSPGQKSL